MSTQLQSHSYEKTLTRTETTWYLHFLRTRSRCALSGIRLAAAKVTKNVCMRTGEQMYAASSLLVKCLEYAYPSHSYLLSNLLTFYRLGGTVRLFPTRAMTGQYRLNCMLIPLRSVSVINGINWRRGRRQGLRRLQVLHGPAKSCKN